MTQQDLDARLFIIREAGPEEAERLQSMSKLALYQENLEVVGENIKVLVEHLRVVREAIEAKEEEQVACPGLLTLQSDKRDQLHRLIDIRENLREDLSDYRRELREAKAKAEEEKKERLEAIRLRRTTPSGSWQIQQKESQNPNQTQN